jgi:hypothetical protein
MIQIERRAGLRLAAMVYAVVLVIAANPCAGQSSTHKKQAPAHEPSSSELFAYVHGKLLQYSPEDGVNDNLEISLDPTSTVLTIKQPDGHCDIFLSALDANTIAWDVYDATDSMQTRAPLARLTVDAIAGKKARTCYDTDNNVDSVDAGADLVFVGHDSRWIGISGEVHEGAQKADQAKRRNNGQRHLQIASGRFFIERASLEGELQFLFS